MNMNKVFIFMLGAVTGSLVTWKLVERKYMQIADEEIEAVVEHYRDKAEKEGIEFFESLRGETEQENMSFEELESLDTGVIDYVNKIEELGYNPDTEVVVLEPTEEHAAPYVISPDEFGEAYDYQLKYFTYYPDGILTDEVGEIVSDIENIVGDALNHFDEFVEGAVHVRNEKEEWDIEIVKEEKTFKEINGEDD